MSLLKIAVNADSTFDITTRKSDTYTDAVYLKFDRIDHTNSDEVRGCNELFLTPDNLECLGRFLIKHADEIRSKQKSRV